MKTKLTIIAVMVGLIICSSNAFGKKLKQEHIDEYGTKIFEASKDSMFAIVKEVLSNHNFEIELEKYEKGLIKTKRKDVGTTGVADHNTYSQQSTAQFRSNYRQYYVTIEETDNNKVKVVFTPKFYIGDADVSEKNIWALKEPKCVFLEFNNICVHRRI